MIKFKANGKELMLVEEDLNISACPSEYKLIGKLSELNDELEEYVENKGLYLYVNYTDDTLCILGCKPSFLSLLKSQGIELKHENYLLIDLKK